MFVSIIIAALVLGFVLNSIGGGRRRSRGRYVRRAAARAAFRRF